MAHTGHLERCISWEMRVSGAAAIRGVWRCEQLQNQPLSFIPQPIFPLSRWLNGLGGAIRFKRSLGWEVQKVKGGTDGMCFDQSKLECWIRKQRQRRGTPVARNMRGPQRYVSTLVWPTTCIATQFPSCHLDPCRPPLHPLPQSRRSRPQGPQKRG